MIREPGYPESAVPLTERPIPAIADEQINLFTHESIRAKPEGPFNALLPEGRPVTAVDIGGDSISAVTMQITDGKPVILDGLVDLSGAQGGAGYLEALEQVAVHSKDRGHPVGISFAGPFEGSRPQQGANVPIFMQELADRWGGDFANLFPTLSAVENDAVAGLRSGALHAGILHGAKDVIYLINGSGMNSSVLHNGQIISMESGHVEVAPGLNPLHQDRPCGMFGAKYVCVEAVSANKAGIEDLYQKQTGKHLSGREIEHQFLAGDNLAGQLYDNSALVSAHVVLGVARTLGMELADGATAIVGHGGTFKFPGYGERLQQIITNSLGNSAVFMMTKDFSDNACLEGAGLSALAGPAAH